MADENDIKDLKEFLALQEDALKGQEKLNELLNQYLGAFGETNDVSITSAEDAKKIIEEIIVASTKQGDLNKNQETSLLNVNLLLKKNLQVEGEQVKIDETKKDLLQQLLKMIENEYKFHLKSLIAEGNRANVLQRMALMKKEISKLSKEEAQAAVKAKIQNFALNNGLATRARALMTTMSSIRAELNKMTSDSERFAEIAVRSADNMAGVSYGEALNAQKELISGLSNYSRMSQEQQQEISNSTVMFEKLGISAQNQVMLIEMATKSFGASSREATGFMAELQSFSERTKVPMSEINKNLGALGDKMAMFGKANYKQVFKDLTAAAKDFGIEASKLVQITEQFTTFEGAAQAAGRLNAVLGGNFVSGIRLMNAALEDPVDVFRQLKTAMDMSGKEFENMTNAQRRYIAEKIGVSVAEAEKLFGQNLEESTQKLEERQKTQKELAELTEKSTQVFQRLEIALLKIVNSPIVGYFVKVVEVVASIIETISESKNPVAEFISGFMGIAAAAFLVISLMVKMAAPIMSLVEFYYLLVQAKTAKVAVTGAEAAADTASAAAETTSTAAKRGGILASIGSTAAKLKDIAVSAAHKTAQLAGAAATGVATMATALFSKATALATSVLGASAPAAAAAGLGFLKIGLIVIGVTAAIAGLVAAIGYIIDSYAKLAEAEARQAEATNEQTKSLTSFSATIKDMVGLEAKLNSFAEGVAEIAKSINQINLETLKELNLLGSGFNGDMSVETKGTAIETRVVPVKVVEIEMNQQQQSQEVVGLQEGGFGAAKEVSLKINSPVTLDGADFGRLIYNGIAIYEDAKSREITPDMSMLTSGQLLNGAKLT